MHSLIRKEVATFTPPTQKSSLLGHVDAGSNDSEVLNGSRLIDGIPGKQNLLVHHSTIILLLFLLLFLLCIYYAPYIRVKKPAQGH